MRRKRAGRYVLPEEHLEFEGARKQIEYLRHSQPSAALLENSKCAADREEFEGETGNGVDFLYEQIQDLYFLAVVRLDLRVWVAISRPRLWMFLVRRDVGSQDIVDKAVEIALEIEEHRRAAAPPDEVVCSRRVDSHTRDSLAYSVPRRRRPPPDRFGRALRRRRVVVGDEEEAEERCVRSEGNNMPKPRA